MPPLLLPPLPQLPPAAEEDPPPPSIMCLLQAVQLPDRDACLAAIHAAPEAGDDVNSRVELSQETPLLLAVRQGDATVMAAIEALLAAGADVGAKDSYGSEALHWAANNHATAAAAAIEALLAAGANVRAKCDLGREPLHEAAHAMKPEAAVAAIQLLVAAGADARAKDNKGREPLHLAVRNLSAVAAVAAIQALLSAGADASDATTVSGGDTPLRLALKRGRVPMESINCGLTMEPRWLSCCWQPAQPTQCWRICDTHHQPTPSCCSPTSSLAAPP